MIGIEEVSWQKENHVHFIHKSPKRKKQEKKRKDAPHCILGSNFRFFFICYLLFLLCCKQTADTFLQTIQYQWGICFGQKKTDIYRFVVFMFAAQFCIENFLLYFSTILKIYCIEQCYGTKCLFDYCMATVGQILFLILLNGFAINLQNGFH